MRYLLFSPVGGTDPISNERDGSMLHICRKYRPEQIALYLSQEMVARHKTDNRYCLCVERLAESLGCQMETSVIMRPDLADVQRFDTFFHEFEPILTQLHGRYPDHTLLLNVASGTPAMKSALYMLAAFLPFPVVTVQVSTPVRAQNPRLEDPNSYDVDLYWAFNKDQIGEDVQDRCEEIHQESLNAKVRKETIEAHLKSYDYQAALTVAGQIRPFLSDRFYHLLEAAQLRIERNWIKIDRSLQSELQLWRGNMTETDLVEYLLWLQVKQNRGDLSDFLRGLTPVLFALMLWALKHEADIDLNKYCGRDNYCRRRDLESTDQGQTVLAILDDSFPRAFSDTFLTSAHCARLIERLCGSASWAAPLLELRRIEERVRNPVAHTLIAVDEDWIQARADGKMSGQILALFKEAAGLLIQSEPLSWGAYNAMNTLLSKRMAMA